MKDLGDPATGQHPLRQKPTRKVSPTPILLFHLVLLLSEESVFGILSILYFGMKVYFDTPCSPPSFAFALTLIDSCELVFSISCESPPLSSLWPVIRLIGLQDPPPQYSHHHHHLHHHQLVEYVGLYKLFRADEV